MYGVYVPYYSPAPSSFMILRILSRPLGRLFKFLPFPVSWVIHAWIYELIRHHMLNVETMIKAEAIKLLAWYIIDGWSQHCPVDAVHLHRGGRRAEVFQEDHRNQDICPSKTGLRCEAGKRRYAKGVSIQKKIRKTARTTVLSSPATRNCTCFHCLSKLHQTIC